MEDAPAPESVDEGHMASISPSAQLRVNGDEQLHHYGTNGTAQHAVPNDVEMG